MTRVFDKQLKLVHFRNPANDRRTLCGTLACDHTSDMFGVIVGDSMKETSERVNCPLCAKVYCAVKNEPWNTQEPFDEETLEGGIYAAVESDTKGKEEKNDERTGQDARAETVGE